jgi:hypothetical protein
MKWSIDGMTLRREGQQLKEKSVTMPFFAPQISHELACD